MIRTRKWAMAAAICVAVVATTPAVAAGQPGTRLVRCAGEDCLLVTGRRDSATSLVRINGHPVAVEGERNWRVRLPISTVRGWSAPFARRIEVSSVDAAEQHVTSRQAELPIGLLGNVPDLAELVITVN
jgi:hypothetical protein